MKKILIASILGILFLTGCENKDSFDDTTTTTERTKFVTKSTKSTTETTTETTTVDSKEYEDNFKKKCKTYKYKDIFRNAEEYDGSFIKVKGEVVQVLEDESSYDIRLNMTKGKYGYWDDTIYIVLSKKNVKKRILEDDIITVWGTLKGLYSYESVLGSSVTLPLVHGTYAEINED